MYREAFIVNQLDCKGRMVKCQELELMFSLAVYPSQSDITNLESNIFNAEKTPHSWQR